MGQSAVDLPDPTSAIQPQTAAAVDDLLAKMAGDEVDRLLGDALADEPDIHKSKAELGAELQGHANAAQAELDALFNELNSQDIPGAPKPAASAAPAAAEAPSPVSTPTAPEETLAPAAAVSESPPQSLTDRAAALIEEARKEQQAPAPASAADALAAEMALDEKQHAEGMARQAAAPAAASPAAPATVPETPAVEIDTDESDDEAAPASSSRMPIVVRILEILDAPFSGLSERARETLAKVAIVTIFNGLAILLYLILFRW